jgi:hypothetical protein
LFQKIFFIDEFDEAYYSKYLMPNYDFVNVIKPIKTIKYYENVF